MKKTVEYVSTLLYYDGPEICRLRQGRTNYIATCLVGITGAPDFLSVSVNAGDWEKFLYDRCDVRFLFTTPASRAVYTFGVNQIGLKGIVMERRDEIIPSDWLPKPRLFASELDNLQVTSSPFVTSQKIFLDGEWESSEFGHLQRKIADIYAFLVVVDGVSDPSENARVKRSFYGKPLAGGSSYGSLFQELRTTIPVPERLQMKAIEKASPGYIELAALTTSYGAMSEILREHLMGRTETREVYLGLHAFLRERKLLRKRISDFSTGSSVDGEMVERATALYERLSIERTDRINVLIEGNSLAFAKVAMALYRRVDEAAMYFAEGRARFIE